MPRMTLPLPCSSSNHNVSHFNSPTQQLNAGVLPGGFSAAVATQRASKQQTKKRQPAPSNTLMSVPFAAHHLHSLDFFLSGFTSFICTLKTKPDSIFLKV